MGKSRIKSNFLSLSFVLYHIKDCGQLNVNDVFSDSLTGHKLILKKEGGGL